MSNCNFMIKKMRTEDFYWRHHNIFDNVTADTNLLYTIILMDLSYDLPLSSVTYLLRKWVLEAPVLWLIGSSHAIWASVHIATCTLSRAFYRRRNALVDSNGEQTSMCFWAMDICFPLLSTRASVVLTWGRHLDYRRSNLLDAVDAIALVPPPLRGPRCSRLGCVVLQTSPKRLCSLRGMTHIPDETKIYRGKNRHHFN
jgi:hypothetical protein